MRDMEIYINSSEMVDSGHSSVIDCANMLVEGKRDGTVAMAIALYYFVRDQVRYDPYTHFHRKEHYTASRILRVRRGNCICKATLLCALARSVEIPARLGFANVRNHLATKQLIEFIGSTTFLFHGYTELFLNEKWVIATPAFNSDLCAIHNVDPLDFDGHNDSIFQPYNSENKIYMEYVAYHGSFLDVPLDKILSAWRKGYGKERVAKWIESIENNTFYEEDVFDK